MIHFYKRVTLPKVSTSLVLGKALNFVDVSWLHGSWYTSHHSPGPSLYPAAECIFEKCGYKAGFGGGSGLTSGQTTAVMVSTMVAELAVKQARLKIWIESEAKYHWRRAGWQLQLRIRSHKVAGTDWDWQYFLRLHEQ